MLSRQERETVLANGFSFVNFKEKKDCRIVVMDDVQKEILFHMIGSEYLSNLKKIRHYHTLS